MFDSVCSFMKEMSSQCVSKIGLWPTVALSAGAIVLVYKTPAVMRYVAGLMNPEEAGDGFRGPCTNSGTNVDEAWRAHRQRPEWSGTNVDGIPNVAPPTVNGCSGTNGDGALLEGEGEGKTTFGQLGSTPSTPV